MCACVCVREREFNCVNLHCEKCQRSDWTSCALTEDLVTIFMVQWGLLVSVCGCGGTVRTMNQTSPVQWRDCSGSTNRCPLVTRPSRQWGARLLASLLFPFPLLCTLLVCPSLGCERKGSHHCCWHGGSYTANVLLCTGGGHLVSTKRATPVGDPALDPSGGTCSPSSGFSMDLIIEM